MSCHNICIHEIHEIRPEAPEDAHACRVAVSVDGEVLENTRLIRDPFSRDQHYALAEYLEDVLGRPRFDQELANEVEESINFYRTRLFSSLVLNDYIQNFDKSTVVLNVFAYSDPKDAAATLRSFTSILSFHWELLEVIPIKSHRRNGVRMRNIWPPSISRVYVRRVVPKQVFSARALRRSSIPRVVPWVELTKCSTDSECRVLLVVARGIFRPGVYEISPSYIAKALLEIFEDLNEQKGHNFYQLEVVRPGSFKELRAHLTRPDRKPFQIVHFDMHGIVKCSKPGCGLPRSDWRLQEHERSCNQKSEGHAGRAYLIFASTDADGRLITSDHPADDIADLLRKNNIHCVALNSCESARTNDGYASNLSYTFLRHGVSNVIAMSFRISDAMFARYFSSFYKAIFLTGRDFSEAASDARQNLQRSRKRESANDDFDMVSMDDWFVPVTYCNDKVVKMPMPETKPPSTDQEDTDAELQSIWSNLDPTLLRVTGLTLLASCWAASLLTCDWHYRSLAIRTAVLSVMTIAVIYLWDLTISLLSLRHTRSLKAREIKCKVLDNNMLNIESELKNCQPIVLHGLEKVSNSLNLIDNLDFVWDRTKFVDVVVVIPAAWFYQSELLQGMRRWCCSRLAHHHDCCQGERLRKREKYPLERQMFIVTDLELIFPQQPAEELNRLQLFLLPYAQRKFKKFLHRNFRDDAESENKKALAVSAGDQKPFLFLSGSPQLQNPEVLAATFDNMRILGIRSTLFNEVSLQQLRTGIIEDHIASTQDIAADKRR